MQCLKANGLFSLYINLHAAALKLKYFASVRTECVFFPQ